jgi:hypothetical protein
MAFARKVLWIVNMTTSGDEAAFVDHVDKAGIDTVCIRTSSDRLPDAVGRFHQLGKTVWAWKWPGVMPADTDHHYYAISEAEYVRDKLLPKGLDGYIVDPESDGHINSKTGKLMRNDWDQKKLAPVAAQFCKIINDAAPQNFLFGTTSGCAFPAKTGKPDIPWKQFFGGSKALYPQCYWRAMLADKKTHKEVPTSINGGTPTKAIARGMAAWTPAAQGRPIIPMAGEIDLATAAEIKEYGQRLTDLGIKEAHFYADLPKVPAGVLNAIKAL